MFCRTNWSPFLPQILLYTHVMVWHQKKAAAGSHAGADGLPVFAAKDPAAWEQWLEKNHATERGVWLRLYKKDSGRQLLTYPESIVIALCFGWIDGVRHKGDAASFLQRFTPRKKNGNWSRINVASVERLIKEKRMRPAGMKEVEEAKADGRWARAYDGQKAATAPEDFMKELKKDKKALAFYESMSKVNKYAISYRLQSAKKPETRAKRFALFLQMMKDGKKFY